MIAAGHDTPETWKVYADWLEEQGDPRGALMRLDPKSREHAELVHANWERWLPGVAHHGKQPTWRNGFVESITLDREFSLELPSLRFLRSLSLWLPSQFSLTGLDRLPCLRTLRVTMPWGHPLRELEPVLRRAHTLTLTLIGEGGNGELDLRGDLPELRRLVLDAASLPQQLLGNLMGAPWISRLESLVLGDLGNSNVGPVLNRGHVLQRLGDRLHLELSRDLLREQRELLRAKFPQATMRYPDVRAYRNPYSERGLWAVREPIDAPANFRTLPPGFTRIGGGAYGGPGETLVSSGAPFGHMREDRWCARCASDRTLCIYAQTQVDDDVRYASSSWWLCEWRCEECGWITTSHRPPDAS